jgi:hypothetical protein
MRGLQRLTAICIFSTALFAAAPKGYSVSNFLRNLRYCLSGRINGLFESEEWDNGAGHPKIRYDS